VVDAQQIEVSKKLEGAKESAYRGVLEIKMLHMDKETYFGKNNWLHRTKYSLVNHVCN